MTEPILPDPREPLTTLAELAMWTQVPAIPEGPPLALANMVLAAVAVVVRYHGSPAWTIENIPPRAKLIADIKAKNFYEHPTGAISESVGPLSESFVRDVVSGLDFTDAEIALLAGLVEGAPGSAVSTGLWSLSTTRGPLETHAGPLGGVLTVPHLYAGAKPYPYYAAGDVGAPE